MPPYLRGQCSSAARVGQDGAQAEVGGLHCAGFSLETPLSSPHGRRKLPTLLLSHLLKLPVGAARPRIEHSP